MNNRHILLLLQLGYSLGTWAVLAFYIFIVFPWLQKALPSILVHAPLGIAGMAYCFYWVNDGKGIRRNLFTRRKKWCVQCKDFSGEIKSSDLESSTSQHEHKWVDHVPNGARNGYYGSHTDEVQRSETRTTTVVTENLCYRCSKCGAEWDARLQLG